MYIKERKQEESKLKLKELKLSKERYSIINHLASKYDRKVKNFVNEVSKQISLTMIDE